MLKMVAPWVWLVGCGQVPSSGEDPSPEGVIPEQEGGTATDPDDEIAPPVGRRPVVPATGGTLGLWRQGEDEVWAVAADPVNDRIVIARADPGAERLQRIVPLPPGSRPSELIVAGDVAYVSLRGTGELVRLELPTSTVAIKDVCPAPRGLDVDPLDGQLWLACASGELMHLDADDLDALSSWTLAPDLRDVVAEGDHLWVSRFRSAELWLLDRTRPRVLETLVPDLLAEGTPAEASPAVAWRMRRDPAGGVVLLHQEVPEAPIGDAPDVYYGETQGRACSSVVKVALTRFRVGRAPVTSGALDLPTASVDLSVTAAEPRFVVVGPDNDLESGVRAFSDYERWQSDPCQPGLPWEVLPGSVPTGPTAVARTGTGLTVYQLQHPFALLTAEGEITTTEPTEADREDVVGFRLFHQNQGVGVACASCHPEGHDDGRIWDFGPRGAWRTMSMRPGILQTAPFHWNGEHADLQSFLEDVMVGRMGGEMPDYGDAALLAEWIDAVPAVSVDPPADEEAVLRGFDLFHDPAVGCAICHAPPLFTNNATVDVGTGLALQVPSLLGLATRAPYMHDGCAATLHDRFTACNTVGHGDTSRFDDGDIADMVAYLETL